MARPPGWRTSHGRRLIPRQQLVQLALWHVGDPREDVREPRFRVDVIETRRHDERRHHRGSLGTRSEPANKHALLPRVKRAGTLRGIGLQADPSIMDEAGEAVPPLKQVVDRLDKVGRTRQRSACSQPSKSLSSADFVVFRRRGLMALLCRLGSGLRSSLQHKAINGSPQCPRAPSIVSRSNVLTGLALCPSARCQLAWLRSQQRLALELA